MIETYKSVFELTYPEKGKHQYYDKCHCNIKYNIHSTILSIVCKWFKCYI